MNNPRAMTESIRPEMLKMGRILRGKTQRQLADETGIDQALISKYENGRPIPESDLETIAATLQLPEKFFYRHINIHSPNGASMLMFRRRQTTTGKMQEQVSMEMNRLSDNVRVLLDSVDLQTISVVPFYEPKTGSSEEIESIAERVRLELRIPRGPIKSMTRVLESIGVVIVRRRMPTKIDALVDSTPGSPTILLLSEDLLGGRQRFTLAHELAHMVMHTALNFTYENLEWQADYFASAFLMPEHDIKSKLRNLTMERLIALSTEWRVSVQALVRRAFDLGVISERQYRSWNEQLGKSGYRTSEPYTIPIEEPSLLSSLIRIHMNDLQYTVTELADALAMEEWEFRHNFLGERTLHIIPKSKKPILRLSVESS